MRFLSIALILAVLTACAAIPTHDAGVRSKEDQPLQGAAARCGSEIPWSLALEEAQRRAHLGKFYYRPPGGESWADVILRLRSMLNTINLHYADKRVLVVAHQVVVLCMRYILEELTEAQILAIDKQAEILNCGICAFDFEPNEQSLCVPTLALWNLGAPLEAEGTPQTAEPDMMTGSR